MKTLPRLAIAAAALALSAHAGAQWASIVMSPQQAMAEMREGKPQAGMPDLRKPVYLRDDAYICVTLNTLAIPNTDVTVRTGHCIFVKQRRRVAVLRATTDQEEIERRMYQIGRVVIRSPDPSDATVIHAWTLMPNLSN